MYSFNLFFLSSALIAFTHVQALKRDYYWRDYTWEVPEDAVIAGRDINDSNVYVGQAYVKNSGLIVTQINPGKHEVRVPQNGIKKINKNVKILCGPQEKFSWMAVESKNLHLSLIEKHAVIGGHEDDLGYIGIGRANLEGEIRVGKVNMFNAGNARLFCDVGGEDEKLISSYQILIYDDKA